MHTELPKSEAGTPRLSDIGVVPAASIPEHLGLPADWRSVRRRGPTGLPGLRI